MSHFCGLVVLTPDYLKGHDLEDSLAKYDEAIDVPEYSCGEVSDFEKIRFIVSYLEQEGVKLVNLKEKLYRELLKEKKVKRWCEKTDGNRERYLYRILNDNKDRYVELFKEVHQNYLDGFAGMYEKHGNEWNGKSWRINYQTGKWEEYSCYNPNSKWDWYCNNGRWSGAVKTKNGEYVDECLLGDIDWTDFKPEDYEEEEQTNIWGKKYKPLKDGVRWHFTKSNVPYCLVVDGDWYSMGDMGWFGCSDDKMTEEEWSNKFMEIINKLPSDSETHNIDFHI